MQRIIVPTFYLLTTLLPLIFTTNSLELFEFPKFLILLAGTFVITIAWLTHAVTTHDWKVRDSAPSRIRLIDYAVIGILITQTIATIFSIHPYTSFWGYYTRFHQGLLTTICYTILYFAAVKWLDKKSTQKIVNISIKTSILISVIAILEHYNVSITCMIMTGLARLQNTQNPLIWSTACWGGLTNPLNRSFATLGQPNWLAAYIIPHIFLMLYTYQTNRNRNLVSTVLHYASSLILFVALAYTSSKSGIIAFVAAYGAYFFFLLRNVSLGEVRTTLIRHSVLFVISAVVVGTPYTPRLSSWFASRTATPTTTVEESVGTALESGGTASGEIRKIVWTGALDLIKRYPLFGTGPETFAYTYYWVRPVAHNYTSETDYLYNKAHNEYLNIAATTGLIGLIAYLMWHYALLRAAASRIEQSKKVNKENETNTRQYLPVLAATVTSFTVTSFFGFSVIPVYFLMVMISALIIPLTRETNTTPTNQSHNAFVLITSIVLISILPARLFLADYYFARGKAYATAQRYGESINFYTRAVSLFPQESLYHSLLSEAYAATGDEENAITHASYTRDHNPYHLNYYKSRAKVYVTFAPSNPAYYKLAAQELVAARELSPTDPKLAYNLGLVYSRLGDMKNTEKQMRDAIELKKNYQEPYYALTLIYEQNKEVDKIPNLLQTARENLATYSGLLKEKMDKYSQ